MVPRPRSSQGEGHSGRDEIRQHAGNQCLPPIQADGNETSAVGPLAGIEGIAPPVAGQGYPIVQVSMRDWNITNSLPAHHDHVRASFGVGARSLLIH